MGGQNRPFCKKKRTPQMNGASVFQKKGAEHGTLAVTEFQSAGKGRLGRRWTAPEGSSIMMSVLLRPDFEPQYASMLTLVMGLSVAQAVRELDIEVSIKWYRMML